jgi:hypothetical protein
VGGGPLDGPVGGSWLGDCWAVGRGPLLWGVPTVTREAAAEAVAVPPGEALPFAGDGDIRPLPLCGASGSPPPRGAATPPPLTGARVGVLESGTSLPALTHAATPAATTATSTAERTPARTAARGGRAAGRRARVGGGSTAAPRS